MNSTNTIHAKAYFNLLKTGSWIEQEVKKALKPFNLTHAQLNVLYILHQHTPEAVSASKVKEQITVSNPDITRLLDRLVNKELVTRETCPNNRRSIDIALTDKGRALFLEAHKATKKALGNFFENQITEEEAVQLRKILHKIGP